MSWEVHVDISSEVFAMILFNQYELSGMDWVGESIEQDVKGGKKIRVKASAHFFSESRFVYEFLFFLLSAQYISVDEVLNILR